LFQALPKNILVHADVVSSALETFLYNEL